MVENILSVLPDRTAATFYRTSGGAEVDLVLTFSGSNVWAIEMKRSLNPSVEKGFYYAWSKFKACDLKRVEYYGSKTFFVHLLLEL